MGGARRDWSRDELLIAFNLYCRIPFGKIHFRNPAIIALAERIGRTPSSVAMKLVNFASLDPAHQARNVRGLSNASQSDRAIWGEFHSDWERLADESQASLSRLLKRDPIAEDEYEPEAPSGPSETVRTVKVRRVQKFFRDAVLSSYEFRCAVCAISTPKVLCASHIIPWSHDVKRRADPTNGLALCALHDRAFDRGLISVDPEKRILISPALRVREPSRLHVIGLLEIEGQPLTAPRRFAPDREALDYHRTKIFCVTPPTLS